MSRLDDLYTKMVDEAPRFFPESNKPYILDLARIYATAMVRHNLERAAAKARTEWIPDDNPKFGHYGDDVIVKESITEIEIELI